MDKGPECEDANAYQGGHKSFLEGVTSKRTLNMTVWLIIKKETHFEKNHREE